MALPQAHEPQVEVQVQHFLRFTRAKRLQHVKECVCILEDAAAGVASGDVYSSDGVRELLAEVKGRLERQVDEVRALLVCFRMGWIAVHDR
jgi:hypothetical protein